jgi:hypothetical protein
MKTFAAITEDNVVVIDLVPRRVDCSTLVPKSIHAIQWDELRLTGHIEYVDDNHNDGQRRQNETIHDIGAYQYLIDAWVEAGVKAEAELKAKNAAAAADKIAADEAVAKATEAAARAAEEKEAKLEARILAKVSTMIDERLKR